MVDSIEEINNKQIMKIVIKNQIQMKQHNNQLQIKQ